jgi:DNA-binding transcriptional LysR family regulator
VDLLREMAVFAHVVDEESFSSAGRKLGLTTSAVSRHVSRLEAHLGARLLQRTTRSLTLTELGQQVYVVSCRVLESSREMSALAGSYSEKPTGIIHLTASVVFGETWLAPRLPGFLAKYPGVGLRVTLVDRTVDLIEKGVDIAVRISSELSPGLAARPLCKFSYVLVASPQYTQRHGAPLEPQNLIEHPCIYLGYGRFGNTWSFRRKDESVDVLVPSRMTINNSSAIVAAARADGGIGLVPSFAAREFLVNGSLVRVLPDWEIDKPYVGDIHAVYTPGRHMAPKIRALIDYLAGATE